MERLKAAQRLNEPIEYLKGVGPAKAELLKKELEIFTKGDLLYHYPFRYIDKSRFYTISEIQSEQFYIRFIGKITQIRLLDLKNRKRLTAIASDSTGQIELVWFQSIQWWQKLLREGAEYIIFGKPSTYLDKFNMVHPELELKSEANIQSRNAFEPVYSSSEKLKSKGLDSKGIYQLQKNLFIELQAEDLPEVLSKSTIEKLSLPSRFDSIKSIHNPKSQEEVDKSVNRIKFEELFFNQLLILRQKSQRKLVSKGYLFKDLGEHFNTFYKEKLPFELTEAQQRVLKEIRKDTLSGRQMNRLLQGDVGSGKTIVALISCLISIDNKFQCCVMAPTEILAQQHFETFTKSLEGLDIKVALLTGNVKGSGRRQILESLNSGNIDILIGTHALIENQVVFKNLGIVVIDEQHRFGVGQRAKLWEKSDVHPHVLVMTATPIPRTLAMTIYGDLDVSVIDTLPPGRKPIITAHRTDSQRGAVFGFIKEEISKGRQVYIVYPLIEESEKLDYKDLMDGYESICKQFPLPQYKIGILHGKMKPSDKEFEMNRFSRGETQIMVSTTVIEVGVNVPNASVMIIESAERFGLSQLHQLRGRVGRGGEQSYCILMTGVKLSSEAKQRIDAMCKTNDGFQLAELDLKLRGPGDIQGTRQSGNVNFHLADLSQDRELLQKAREEVLSILETDPELILPEHKSLLTYVHELSRAGRRWSKIS